MKLFLVSLWLIFVLGIVVWYNQTKFERAYAKTVTLVNKAVNRVVDEATDSDNSSGSAYSTDYSTDAEIKLAIELSQAESAQNRERSLVENDEKTSAKKHSSSVSLNSSVKGFVAKNGFKPTQFPNAWIAKLMLFENAPLATGKIKSISVSKDPLVTNRVVNQTGYGITMAEMRELGLYGYMPKGSRLPTSLTREQARVWLIEKTLPCYEQQVMDSLKKGVYQKLSLGEKFQLVCFCHNLGKDAVKTVANKPKGLNNGGKTRTQKEMLRYVHASGEYHKGLDARRKWELAVAKTKM